MKFIPYAPLTLLALSGCITPYQTNFDCPVPPGVPCTSMTKINHMIDKGVLGKPESTGAEGCTCASTHPSETDRKIQITHFHPRVAPTVAPTVAPIIPEMPMPGEDLEAEDMEPLEPTLDADGPEPMTFTEPWDDSRRDDSPSGDSTSETDLDLCEYEEDHVREGS